MPFAVPPPEMSTHLPRTWIAPSPVDHVNACAVPPVQSQSWIGVPFAVEPPASSTHFEPLPTIGPVTWPP